jgi:lipopolysaccharide exporter
MARNSTNRTLLSGSFWISLSEILKGAAELGSAIVAARVLAPHDLGLMGIVLLTIAILESFSRTGFDQALVQKQDAIEPYLNVAWTWHVLRGIGLATLLAVAAPFVASWYGEPVLQYLIWVACAHVLLQGAQNIGTVFFSRDLDFRTICLVNALRAFAHAGVAIPAVIYYRNVWGLIIGLVAAAAVGTVVSYIVHPYRPRFEWNWPKARELVTFGRWITGLSVMLFVITQGDDIFVSKYLGPAALAFYQLAYSISNLPATKITHVISKVSFPTYSRLQNDKDALREAFYGVMRTTVLLSAPLGVAIWMVVPGIVEHVIGPKWEPIIVLVRILVLSAFVRSIAALGGALFQACGRPDLDFKMNVPRFVVVVGLIYPFTARWGLEGASWVVFLAISTTLPVWFYGVRKLVGLTLLDVVRANLLALIGSIVLALCFYAAEVSVAGIGLASVWVFVAHVLLALGGWAAVMWLLGRLTPLDLFSEVRRLIVGPA